MENDTELEITPKPKLVHITIRGKPVCACRFSDTQTVALINAIQGKVRCTFAHNDPKLKETFDAIKDVVSDPTTVAIHNGDCSHSRPSMIPPGMMGKVKEMIFDNPEALQEFIKKMDSAYSEASGASTGEVVKKKHLVGRIPKALLDSMPAPKPKPEEPTVPEGTVSDAPPPPPAPQPPAENPKKESDDSFSA